MLHPGGCMKSTAAGFCSQACRLIAEKAYDADDLRSLLAQQSTEAVISPTPNGAPRRDSISSAIVRATSSSVPSCRLKSWRGIATRYDEIARNFISDVCLATAAMDWLRWVHSPDYLGILREMVEAARAVRTWLGGFGGSNKWAITRRRRSGSIGFGGAVDAGFFPRTAAARSRRVWR
jgi:hypothetical protein